MRKVKTGASEVAVSVVGESNGSAELDFTAQVVREGCGPLGGGWNQIDESSLLGELDIDSFGRRCHVGALDWTRRSTSGPSSFRGGLCGSRFGGASGRSVTRQGESSRGGGTGSRRGRWSSGRCRGRPGPCGQSSIPWVVFAVSDPLRLSSGLSLLQRLPSP